ncbi:MAG: AAA family ATPase [Candidatus Hydrogenedentes bacterium]|nr:AAA family ATPase [Candidatus Hydrogenedentota bacterium]
MKIQNLLINGYGKLSEAAHEFVPGLQVIVGPNERGKSTLRAFIADMLYGQKRNPRQRVYDDANRLREPWDKDGDYGGTLVYALDDGEVFEVTRSFSRKSENVQVYSRTHARDLTRSFPRLKNGELNFAPVHLGISKDVFLNVATIGHISLDGLGDVDAMKQIREKLLTLADSGDEQNSSEAALKSLEQRIQIVGQPSARTRPLPSARARLEELNREHQTAEALQRELAAEETERQALRHALAERKETKSLLERQIRALEAHERADRLDEAEALAQKIDAATQQCFALSKYRDFPVEDAPEAQRLEGLCRTAEQELGRIERDHLEFTEQLENEQGNGGGDTRDAMEAVPEADETRLTDLNAALQHLQQRIDETDAQAREADLRLETSLHEIGNLPDFSRLASDPVEWFTQLASSFDVARRTRNEECAQRARMRDEVARREAEIAGDALLFEGVENFLDTAREYDFRRRQLDEQTGQKQNYLMSLQGTREEVADNTGFLVMAGLCVAVLVTLLYLYSQGGQQGILIAVTIISIAIAFFLGNYVYSKTRTAQLDRIIEKTRLELSAIEFASDPGSDPLEQLMAEAGCATVRELEARHEEYRALRAELDSRRAALLIQEEKAREAEDRIPLLLLRFQQTFAQTGVEIVSEDDVSSGAGRAISRYQEYREAKRRASECRTFCERYRSELKRLEQVYQEAIAERSQVEAGLYAFMEAHGFTEARQAGGILAALRAYRERIAQFRERMGRAELIVQKQSQLAQKQADEEQILKKHRATFLRVLERAGVDTAEAWHAARQKAGEYRDIWSRRTALEEQLNALLRGQDLNQLRARVAQEAPLPEKPDHDALALEGELESCIAELEVLQEEEHAIHLELTEKSSACRSLNEIEEEQAVLQRRVEELSLELEAASYAMALVEDIARMKHAQIAPALAETAGQYLSQITSGAYDEVLISRDLSVSVRIPQTNRLSESPEKSLSKGTVDQVYLALRLAFVKGIGANGESIPMLLDDPFANYDDERLVQTLGLIEAVAAENQVLLFTCREDVVTAAEGIGAKIIRI